MKRRPHLRTILLAVNMLILLLPIGGIGVLHLYENELIWQTESELSAQGAFVAAAFSEELARRHERIASRAASPRGQKRSGWESRRPTVLGPLLPRLDIATDVVRGRAEDAIVPTSYADPDAVAVGAWIEPVLISAAATTLSGIRVTDGRGTVVASTGSELGMSLLPREEVRRALKGERVSILRERASELPSPPLESISRPGRVRVFVALPVLLDKRVVGSVVLSRTPLDVRKALYINRRYLIGGGIALVLVVILVSGLTAMTISRPVSALIGQAEKVARGEKMAATPLARPGTYEVDRLSRALAEMSAILDRRADYIRTFASNVSHEFKTPLTSLRGTIELLRDHLDRMSPEERDRFLDILDKDTERLNRLVQRLLELARADVFKPGMETADVSDVVDRVARRYRSSGLPVTVAHDPGAKAVKMAADTLDSVLSNLVDNARQHGGENVNVVVTTRHPVSSDFPCVEIEVRDSGRGVDKSDLDRIFNPFFTTAREAGGTGLGLSIVRTLVLAHGGTVEAAASESGSTFVIKLPSADIQAVRKCSS